MTAENNPVLLHSLNAEARDLEATIAANVAEILEA